MAGTQLTLPLHCCTWLPQAAWAGDLRVWDVNIMMLAIIGG